MNIFARKFRGFLINAPLNCNIIAIFIAIFLLLAGSLIWYNYSRNSELALEAADSLLLNVSEKVLEKTRNFIDPPVTLIHLTAELPDIALLPSGAEHSTAQYFLDALASYPQLYGLFVGYENGDFFQVVQFADVDAKTKTRLKAPPSANYGVRTIALQPDGTRKQSWIFLDADRKAIGDQVVSAASYDPRGRPWYKAALNQSKVFLTDAYIFSSLRAPGITVSRKVDSDRNAVVAADITLAQLSSFLRDQKVGESGVVFLYNEKTELIAFPDVNRTVKTVTEGGKTKLKPVRVEELERPSLTEAIKHFAGKTDDRFVYSVSGEDYVASVSSLMGSFGSNKRVGIVVPVDDFIGPIAEHRIRSLIYSIIPLLLSVPLIAWVSEWIARPIRALVEETKKIRDLSFDDDSPEIDSRITEIRELAASMATMKTAIRTFGQYVPKALVEQLIRSGNVQGLGGERRELSILFTDVANFTDLSEQMSPEDLTRKTSRYFQELGEIILKNQGSIDKYIGDAIMAFWNAPLAVENHTLVACRTMLLCRQRSAELNAEWSANGEPEMHTRFGLHTGDTVVGNIGSPDRMDYTALGVSVNLAARLEGLNKRYGTQLLVSESVFKAAGDAFLFRPIDLAAVKGISKRVATYELCAAYDGPSPILATEDQKSFCRRWNEIYDLFRASDWEATFAALQGFLTDYPDDQVAKIYLERCRRQIDKQPQHPETRVAHR
jgi:adenylate cyclase